MACVYCKEKGFREKLSVLLNDEAEYCPFCGYNLLLTEGLITIDEISDFLRRSFIPKETVEIDGERLELDRSKPGYSGTKEFNATTLELNLDNVNIDKELGWLGYKKEDNTNG